jgi:hypothetical protein
MPRSIIRTATTAIAIAALAAPTALARPAETPPAVEKATAAAQHKQDARSPDAIDAATSRKQAGHPYATSGYPTSRAQGDPRLETTPEAPADSSVAWSMLGLGIAGLLIIAAIAGLASRTRRSGRARIAA